MEYCVKMAVGHVCCAAVLVSTVFRVATVRGDHLLTIGVVLSGESSSSSAMKTTEYTIQNRTDPEVLVHWSVVEPQNPFRLAQQYHRFADLGADIVVLPEDMAPSLRASPLVTAGTGNSTPSIVTYQTKPADKEYDLGEGCLKNFRPPGWGIGAEVECSQNTTQTEVDRVGALVAVIKSLGWTDLIILFEDSEEMLAKELSDKLSAMTKTTHFLIYSLDHLPDQPDAYLQNLTGLSSSAPAASAQDQLLFDLLDILYFRRTEELRVVLLCSVACTARVLTAASQFDDRHRKKTAMRMVSRWLMILPPEMETMLEQCDLHLDNVAAILHPPGTNRAIGNLTKEMPSILTSAYENLIDFNLTLTKDSLSQSFSQILMQPDRCYGSLVKTLLWKPEGRRLSDVGFVSPDGELFCRSDVFPNIKFGMNNRTFLVATLPWPSFVEREANGSYRGLCVDLLRQLQTALNFSYQWTEPADGEWGTLRPDGTWTGLVGMLERQEVDLVVAPLSIQAEREKVMDFIHPFYLDYTTVLLKLPDPNESKWRRLIQPFKPQVHMCIWISLLGVTLITAILEAVNPFYITHPRSMLHIGDMFWYMYGALLTQGGARLPDSQTGRTMVSIFWLFSIVMAAIYSGNLIAFMTVSKEEAPFQTVKGMVNQDEYKWGVVGGTSWVNVFQTSKNEVFRKVWAGIESNRGTDPDILSGDPEVHLAKVKAGKYAYIGDKSAITTWLLSECDLIAIKEEFLPLQYSIGLVNNSAYTPMFSDEMLNINEIGLTETWTRKWWRKTSFCKGSLIKEPQPIYLIDVQSAFYLIFIGITLAFLVLGLERLCSRYEIGSRFKQFFRRKKQEQERRGASFRRSVFGSRKKRAERIEIHTRGLRNGGVYFYGERRRTMNPLFYDEGGGEGGGGLVSENSRSWLTVQSSSSLGQNGLHHSGPSCDTNMTTVSDNDEESIRECAFSYSSPTDSVRFFTESPPSPTDSNAETDSAVVNENTNAKQNGSVSRRRSKRVTVSFR